MNRMTRIVAGAAVGLVTIALAVLALRPDPSVGPPASATPAIPTPPAASIVGTWDVTFTTQEMLDVGVISHIATDPDDYGHFRLTFTDDQWQLSHLSPATWVSAPVRYTVDPGVIHIGQPGDTSFNTPYTVTATTLSFGQEAPTSFSIKPWSRVATEPFASPIPRPVELHSGDAGTSLDPGTYRVRGFAVPFTIALPAGWTLAKVTTTSFAIERLSDASINLFMAVADKVYPDPCHTDGGPTTLEPGTDALVSALSSMPNFEVTDVADASIGGADGKTFKFSNAIDVGAANCSGEMLPFATHDEDGEDVDIAIFGGETDQFWVLDADGTTLLLAITDNRVATLQPLLDSIAFDGS